ncbi:MAG: GrpB family protein [Gammaproteobacteria bacterium]|nr:GrpB family protein [Gammaproteobacteria bacterium]MYF31715.1 GrpB family protein [Gammaproteobacteria bacterium]MYK46651.1 GrpB family protein [Gammaproteobacteria bacterium]
MKFLLPDEYQPAATHLFERVAEEVRRHVPESRIEHVGASAVPGAISKGDLDVFVGVPRERFEQTIGALGHLGYSVKADTLRTESLCMLETHRYPTAVALQVVENGSRFEMFLTFRDALRRDAALLCQYNDLKRACEGLGEDCYRTRKAAFIKGVLASH